MAKILIPLAPGFEELEAVTLIDLLRRAGNSVCVASLGEREVRGNHEIELVADVKLEDVLDREYDLIALPGGLPGAHHLRDDARLRKLLLKHANGLLAAICAAPLVLAAAGLLDNHEAAAFPGQLNPYPQVQQSGEGIVRDRNRITGRGPGVALDFALTLIEVLNGRQKREEVEGRLQR